MPPIFSVSYWFAVHPAPMMPFFQWFFAIFFLLLLLLGFYARSIVKKKRKQREKYLADFYQKISSFSFFMAMFGALWLFFALEQINVLGSRFWIIIWTIVALAGISHLVMYRYKVIPLKIEKWKMYQAHQQYMPKKKK